MNPHRYIVVMGVAGCGKSSLGRQLADALQCRFVEGDSLHPARNVALMAAGTALTDTDRADWLASMASLLGECAARGEPVVVSCSALKRRYRDQLRAACPSLRLVPELSTRLLELEPSMGSKIINGTRQLTAAHIRRLSAHFALPAEYFL